MSEQTMYTSNQILNNNEFILGIININQVFFNDLLQYIMMCNKRISIFYEIHDTAVSSLTPDVKVSDLIRRVR